MKSWILILSASCCLLSPNQNVKSQTNSSDQECTLYRVNNPANPSGSPMKVTVCPDNPPAEVQEDKNQNSKDQIKKEQSRIEREKADLAAQQSMAYWTRAIGKATIIGIPLTILGLLAIWVTIRQNQKTFKHIQTASAEELRPYLNILVRLVTTTNPTETCRLEITIENTGKTAMFDGVVVNLMYMRWVHREPGVGRVIKTVYEIDMGQDTTHSEVAYIAPDGSSTYTIVGNVVPCVVPVNFPLGVKGTISYSDISTNEAERRVVEFEYFGHDTAKRHAAIKSDTKQ